MDIHTSNVIRIHDPRFWGAKTLHALDSAATVVGRKINLSFQLKLSSKLTKPKSSSFDNPAIPNSNTTEQVVLALLLAQGRT
jgi:hypothetical protein